MSVYPNLSGEFNPTVPSRVVFGRGRIRTLGAEVAGLAGKRALVLSGRSIAERTTAVNRVQDALGELSAGVYSGLTQRAPLATAVEAANLAVSLRADTLVGVGGSTISDAARMIAVLMAEGVPSAGELSERGQREGMMLRPSLDGRLLPWQVSIPTTLSAGEFNMGGGNVLDDQAGHKIRVSHPRLYADLVVLDPDVTEGTPDWLWLSSGVKALDHCIERLYCSGNQPAIDAPVLTAAEMLFDSLPRSRQSDADPEARLRCLIAAWMSMMGAPNFAVGLSHAIGHIVGVKYGVGHGYTSCVSQPYVMEYNRPASAAKQALLARAAAHDTRGLSDEAAAELAARAVDEFILGLGMPHRLRELEIPEVDLPEIAELVLTDRGCLTNAIPITEASQVMEVLRNAY